MISKKFTLNNFGMNRDLSESKVGESCVWENHNIRIVADENATTLSVTNERGTKEITLSGQTSILGTVIGWNTLNNYLILFTHQAGSQSQIATDRIYRIEYTQEPETFTNTLLFDADLNFSSDAPIESITHYESETVQKIYWVDGINVLRFMNFVAPTHTVTISSQSQQIYPWQDNTTGNYDTTYFDSNRAPLFDVYATIEKDWTGNARPNGTVQYILTYYNKYGQETGPVWCSDIVYLAPADRGGEADGINTNSIRLSFNLLDKGFEHFKVYSIFRSALNGTVVSNLIADAPIGSTGTAIVIDDYSHYTAVDTTQLLYLGSKPVKPSTLTEKDGTLFIGDLQSTTHDISGIKSVIEQYYISNGEAQKVTFTNVKQYSQTSTEYYTIPYVEKAGLYPYENQLKYNSSEITTFKYGEKYRFALKFGFDDGSSPEVVWIGDKENSNVPPSHNESEIARAVAKCELTVSLLAAMETANVKTVQLMIAEASYSDRKILAQGIVNPTVFNVWERYNDRLYAMPSWITRPRRSGIASNHFKCINSSDSKNCEIQCNYPLDSSLAKVQVGESNITLPDRYIFGYNDFMVIVQLNVAAPGTRTFYGAVYLVEGYVIRGQRSDLYEWNFQLNPTVGMGEAFPSVHFASLDCWDAVDENGNEVESLYYDDPDSNFRVTVTPKKFSYDSNVWSLSSTEAWENEFKKFYIEYCSAIEYFGLNPVSEAVFVQWAKNTKTNQFSYFKTLFFNDKIDNPSPSQSSGYDNFTLSATNNSTPSVSNWHTSQYSSTSGTVVHTNIQEEQAKYRKNLMYVDESVVTFNSPELDYEAVTPDDADYGFRIVGIAKVSSQISDYTVDASMGKLAGNNLLEKDFSSTSVTSQKYPITAWPVWREFGLSEADAKAPFAAKEKRTSDYYVWNNDTVRYWVYMWNRAGVLSGYYPLDQYESTDSSTGVSVSVDDNSERYSYLHRKVFANLTFCYDTKYVSALTAAWECSSPSSLRFFNQSSSRATTIEVDGAKKYYDGVINLALTMPDGYNYPIYFSTIPESVKKIEGDGPSVDMYLYSNDPVYIKYAEKPHAVISLGKNNQNKTILLPKVSTSQQSNPDVPDCTDGCTPSYNNNISDTYSYTQSTLTITDPNCPYLFIGEIYRKFTSGDTRYGGTSPAAISNCRFIPAGPRYYLSDTLVPTAFDILGDRGDTYYQRYDSLRTVPFSDSAENSVIDIASVMLETHINLDGRTDKLRGTKDLASIDVSAFGKINPVYSQKDNFYARRIDKRDYNASDFRSHFSWTSEKHDMADTDEWAHITLASSMSLDASRGICNALRTFGGNILAFQNKGISQVMFNSRVQVPTSDGMPIELTNSNKVDGTRYLTTKYGVSNKWSIVEGKKAIYFIDSMCKAFCSFDGSQIEDVSMKRGFSTWFKRNTTTQPWSPTSGNTDAVISFYDKLNSDVYLVRNIDDNDENTLVYNENLGTFTSFFDYAGMPMLTNMADKLISYTYRGGKLWEFHQGLFCQFFNSQHDYWVQYRVAPEPQKDKIWSNIEYRTDFYRALNGSGELLIDADILDGGNYDDDSETVTTANYLADETFSTIKVWNEYQQTDETLTSSLLKKKFRIWRFTVPRAKKDTDTNKYGLDRIRNPWVNIKFFKDLSSDEDEHRQDLMQLHDIEVQYYE